MPPPPNEEQILHFRERWLFSPGALDLYEDLKRNRRSFFEKSFLLKGNFS
jgi:hypothetical protein